MVAAAAGSMPKSSQIETVILTVHYSTRASYYLDWLEAFAEAPHFSVTIFNLFRREDRRAAMRAVETSELTVALHACSADTLEFIKPLAGALKARRGRFLMLVGNEYNLPWIRLAEKRDFVRDVAADWVGTQLPLEAGQWLYEDTAATVLPLPHALKETAFRRDRPDAMRDFDIGGRSARYPIYLGDDDRNRIYDVFAQIGPGRGLRVDISNEGRRGRPEWAAFLNNCRGTIGTEAGSWYLERDDRTVLEISDFIRAKENGGMLRANGRLHNLLRHLPIGLKLQLTGLLKWLPIRHEAFDDGSVEFSEIFAQFFAGRPRCPAYSKCISSRNFDAAGTGTCQILLRGRYNDILQEDEHYIAVDPDLGNVEEALDRFEDPGERCRIGAAAYALAHDMHTYRHRIAALHERLLQ